MIGRSPRPCGKARLVNVGDLDTGTTSQTSTRLTVGAGKFVVLAGEFSGLSVSTDGGHLFLPARPYSVQPLSFGAAKVRKGGCLPPGASAGKIWAAKRNDGAGFAYLVPFETFEEAEAWAAQQAGHVSNLGKGADLPSRNYATVLNVVGASDSQSHTCQTGCRAVLVKIRSGAGAVFLADTSTRATAASANTMKIDAGVGNNARWIPTGDGDAPQVHYATDGAVEIEVVEDIYE